MSYQNPAYTSPTYPAAPVTADALSGLDPQAVRMLWKKGFDTFETEKDFFADMEGDGDDYVINTVSDMAAGSGSQITFTIASEFYWEPHFGSQYFTDSSHFEQLLIGNNALWVDFVRHGTRFDQRAEEVMGMRGEVVSFLGELQDGVPGKLGGWAGRLKSEQLFMMWREVMPAQNTIPLGTSLQWFPIVNSTAQMKRNGALPCMVGKDAGGNPIKKYVVIADGDALNSLENDPNFINFLTNTKDPQGCTYLWQGGWPELRGHHIKEHPGLIHDGYGPQGSPMKPIGLLGQAIALTSQSYNTPLNIYGGGTDLDLSQNFIKPLKWFPNYPFQWGPGTLNPVGGQPNSLAAGTQTFFIAIVNPLNANTDPGRWGLYACKVNNGVYITATAALVDNSVVASHVGTNGGPNLTNAFSSTDGSVSGDSVGLGTGITGLSFQILQTVKVFGTKGGQGSTSSPGVAWTAGVNSVTHPVGAAMYMVGPDAIPVFTSFILSADCARRGYGKWRGQRVADSKEGGFIQERYFMSVFGQNLRTNRIGAYPGAIKLFHLGTIQGTPLPQA